MPPERSTGRPTQIASDQLDAILKLELRLKLQLQLELGRKRKRKLTARVSADRRLARKSGDKDTMASCHCRRSRFVGWTDDCLVAGGQTRAEPIDRPPKLLPAEADVAAAAAAAAVNQIMQMPVVTFAVHLLQPKPGSSRLDGGQAVAGLTSERTDGHSDGHSERRHSDSCVALV